jgi:hypothetical protein
MAIVPTIQVSFFPKADNFYGQKSPLRALRSKAFWPSFF